MKDVTVVLSFSCSITVTRVKNCGVLNTELIEIYLNVVPFRWFSIRFIYKKFNVSPVVFPLCYQTLMVRSWSSSPWSEKRRCVTLDKFYKRFLKTPIFRPNLWWRELVSFNRWRFPFLHKKNDGPSLYVRKPNIKFLAFLYLLSDFLYWLPILSTFS